MLLIFLQIYLKVDIQHKSLCNCTAGKKKRSTNWKQDLSAVQRVLIGDEVNVFQAIYRPVDTLCYEKMEKRLQRMLVTHSVCAGACWYGSSPGAVPATGTARGWAAHPTQRKKHKGQKA